MNPFLIDAIGPRWGEWVGMGAGVVLLYLLGAGLVEYWLSRRKGGHG